ncbi:MAG: aldo/keto reductase, partial [Rhodospirillales bacterium]
MKRNSPTISRRRFLAGLAGLGVGGAATSVCRPALARPGPLLTKAIPATGEQIPVIGMGSWLTFNVGSAKFLRDKRAEVLRAFFEAGGAVIDSSPMYGSSQEVIGYCLKRIFDTTSLFSATKVWTPFQWHGAGQMEKSAALWGVDAFDLIQVHNLLAWEKHLETLIKWKSQGRVRYIGVTTSHGRRHRELEKIMTDQPIDFVQFTYNIVDREAESRLLGLAAERRLAVIVNRPFQGGSLFDRFEDR